MTSIADFLFHFESWLNGMMQIHPFLICAVFFCILFLESAFLPLAPFLPGDGLLFGVGVLAANGLLNIYWVIPVLILGGILGNWVAYLLGQRYGFRLFELQKRFNRGHYDQTVRFYGMHGTKAFLFSRYVPVIRSLIPFVAGMAKIKQWHFLLNNLLSVSIWVISLTLFSYYLGQLSFVKHHFTVIVFSLVIVGFLGILFFTRKPLISKSRSTKY